MWIYWNLPFTLFQNLHGIADNIQIAKCTSLNLVSSLNFWSVFFVKVTVLLIFNCFFQPFLLQVVGRLQWGKQIGTRKSQLLSLHICMLIGINVDCSVCIKIYCSPFFYNACSAAGVLVHHLLHLTMHITDPGHCHLLEKHELSLHLLESWTQIQKVHCPLSDWAYFECGACIKDVNGQLSPSLLLHRNKGRLTNTKF